MKNIFFMTTLLLGNQLAFGMNPEKILDMLSIDPKQLAIESAALSLNIENHEVNKLQQINESEIQEVIYIKSDNYYGYHATLKDGDIIAAEFFVAGPYNGSFNCTRSKENKNGDITLIPLDKNVYNQLRDLHEAQKGNKPH